MKINLESEWNMLEISYKNYNIIIYATYGELYRIYINGMLFPMKMSYLKSLMERLDELYPYLVKISEFTYYVVARWINYLMNNPITPEIEKKLERAISISRGKNGRS